MDDSISFEEHRKRMLHKMSNGDVLEGFEIHAEWEIRKAQRSLESADPNCSASVARQQQIINSMRGVLKIRQELEAYIAKKNLAEKP